MKKLLIPQWIVLLALVNDNEVKLFSEKFENDTTLTFLSKKTGFTFNSVEKNIKFLEGKGYLTTIKKNRCKYITLTNKGRDLSFHLCKTLIMLQYNNI